MMNPDAWAYLHDAAVLQLSLAIDGHGISSLRLEVESHSDTGHSDWNGKHILIIAREIVLCSFDACGYSSNRDTIRDISNEVSATFTAKIADLTSRGVRVPRSQLQLMLNSGTLVELVCRNIDVELHNAK